MNTTAAQQALPFIQQPQPLVQSPQTSANITYNMIPQVQSVTIDGQEAIFIPASLAGQTIQLAGNQGALCAPVQQGTAMIRTPQGIQTIPQGQVQGLPQLGNLGIGGLSNLTPAPSITIRPASIVQTIQVQGMHQPVTTQFAPPVPQTVSVQIPVSTTNGQTVMQTIQLPLSTLQNMLPMASQCVPVPQIATTYSIASSVAPSTAIAKTATASSTMASPTLLTMSGAQTKVVSSVGTSSPQHQGSALQYTWPQASVISNSPVKTTPDSNTVTTTVAGQQTYTIPASFANIAPAPALNFAGQQQPQIIQLQGTGGQTQMFPSTLLQSSLLNFGGVQGIRPNIIQVQNLQQLQQLQNLQHVQVSAVVLLKISAG